MSRTLLVTALAGAALAAAAAPAPAAPVQGDEVARFRRAFSGDDSPASGTAEDDRTVADRLAAARAIALVDSRSAAEAVCKGFAATLEGLEALAKERSRVREEMASLRAEGEGSRRTEERLAELRLREDDLRFRDRGRRDILRILRRTLTAYRDPRAIDYLSQTILRSGPHPGVRAAVAEALGVIGDPAALKGVRNALKDRDPEVRAAVLAALVRLREKQEEVLAALAPALEDERWTVRLAAMRQLAALASPEAVDVLVGRLGKEDGRLREDLASLLRSLTGQKFGIEPEGWTHWWGENREAYASGERELTPPGEEAAAAAAGEAREGEGVSYYGITTRSKRILYILDVSGSMNSPGGTSVELLKIDEAKKELLRSIRSLGPDSWFSVFAFGDAVKIWKPALVKAADGNKDGAGSWIRDLMAAHWTNTYAALEEGIRISAADPRNNMGPGYDAAADTIFLLTDGAPTTPDGKLVDGRGVKETQRVLEAVREWNREKRVVIHTIGVGPAVDDDFLRTLARENGGEYRRVQ